MSKAARKKPATRGSARPASTRGSTRPASTRGAAPPAGLPSSAQTPTPGSTGPNPVTLRIAVWLLAAEALALGVLAGLMLYGDLTGGAQTQQSAIGVIGFVVVIAAVLGVLSWALRGRRAWARGPAIVLHMFLLPFGIAFTTNGQPLIGVAAILAGVGGGAVLLAPATRAAVGRE